MMQCPQKAEGDAFGHRLYHEAIVDRIDLGAKRRKAAYGGVDVGARGVALDVGVTISERGDDDEAMRNRLRGDGRNGSGKQGRMNMGNHTCSLDAAKCMCWLLVFYVPGVGVHAGEAHLKDPFELIERCGCY